MELSIPSGVNVEIRDNGKEIRIKGKKGEIVKNYYHPLLEIEKKDNTIYVKAKKDNAKMRAIEKTVCSQLKNAFDGVEKGYRCKLVVLYEHFPISVAMENRTLKVSNYYGERKPRLIEIPEGVDVKVSKKEITVEGPDKELVGDVAARIQQGVQIKNRDRRRFQDGIYVVEKAKVIE
jgi:large subunit ribosomal protein L6